MLPDIKSLLLTSLTQMCFKHTPLPCNPSVCMESQIILHVIQQSPHTYLLDVHSQTCMRKHSTLLGEWCRHAVASRSAQGANAGKVNVFTA